MNLATFAARNVLRNRFRAVMTMIGVAVAVISFMLLRTVISAWTVGAEFAAKDRIVTRNKITFVMPLPKRYVQQVKDTPGVRLVNYANWFGGKDPKHDREFFATIAADAPTMFQVYDEASLDAGQKETWLHDRQGAIVGEVLAKKMGWKVGDKVILQSGIYGDGNWEFTIDGTYKALRKSLDNSQFIFHWDYLNDRVPARTKDQVGWIVARLDDPSRSADLARTIDTGFEEREIQTLSQDERSFNTSFLASFSAVLSAIDIVSVAILVIMMLVLGNTIAMGVRERTSEYGVLRAVGFAPGHIAFFVLGESIVIGLAGGLLGAAIAYPIVERGLGRWIEENMGTFFPYFRIDPMVIGAALLLATVLAMAAAAIPAYRASKVSVVDALRKVG
jgi:putative ABC transport system permease protein